MTDPTVPPGSAPEQPAPSASGFFGWVRGLGIVRSDGWIGGVCSGVAVRIGIDPIIVRGLFIVLTLLGLPMVLLYAVAWALLPDSSGSIHLQNLFHGRFDPPMIAIIIVLVLTFVPVIPTVLGLGLWPLGTLFGGDGTYGISPVTGAGSVILSLALVALIVVAIVKMSKNRAARQVADETGPYAGYTQSGYPTPDDAGRHQGVSWHSARATADATFPPDARTAPSVAFTAAPDTTASAPTGSVAAPDARLTPPAARATADAPGAQVASDASVAGAPTSAAPSAPATPTAPAAPTYDEWRRQHENWLGSSEQWRAQQADADKRARQQARAEAIARGQELSRQASVQAKARRAANPRMSFGFVAAVVGVGVIAAATVALLAAPQGAFLAATAALLVAGAIGGLGMALAGALRLRSGFLTFLTVSVLAFALPMGFLAAPFATDPKTAFALTSSGPDSLVAIGQMVVDGASNEDREFVQFFGGTDVYVSGSDTTADPRGGISIVKGGGQTDIHVAPGAELDLHAVLADGAVIVYDQNPDTGEFSSTGMKTGTSGPAGTAYDLKLSADKGERTLVTQPVSIVQKGSVSVYLEVNVKGQN